MSLVNSDTGEVVSGDVIAEFSEEEARAHVDKMRGSVAVTAELIVEAYQRRVWKPLGYKTWESFVDGEFPAVGMNATARQVLMVGLRNAGMSLRSIGAVTGVSPQTVMRETPGVPNGTPVTGADGKSYEPTRPAGTSDETPDQNAGEAGDGDDRSPYDGADTSPAPLDPGESADGDDAGGLHPASSSPGSPIDERAREVQAVLREVGRAHEVFTLWTPEELHELNDPVMAEAIETLLEKVARWGRTYAETKPNGLVAINGGKA